MSRYHRAWTDRFSGYLAEELPEAERLEVEAHVALCGPCRDVLAGLREVVARARGLEGLDPPRDLWPGVASAIGGPVRVETRLGHPNVIDLTSARHGAGSIPTPRGLPRLASLRWAGLAAAAVALISVSAGTTWWIASTRPATFAGDRPTSSIGGSVLTADTGTPPEGMATELAALEDVLDAARGVLDPNTVRVLERNLGVIEQAIADSRHALELDPGNAFLVEHLERMYRRKLVYLQDVVRVVQWAG